MFQLLSLSKLPSSNILHYFSKIKQVIAVYVGIIRANQNTGGALLEVPVRTAMHGKSCVSSAIEFFLRWTTLGIV